MSQSLEVAAIVCVLIICLVADLIAPGVLSLLAGLALVLFCGAKLIELRKRRR